MKLWEFRIKQYEYSLSENDIVVRTKKNCEVEEILSDYGKEGFELVSVITEPILKNSNLKNKMFLRTFFLKRERP